jgi:hypothetical protein
MNLFVFLTTFIFLASIALGLFLILRPDQVIELQKRFYFKINWRMEPVNMALEIRNTRMMGFMIMGVVIACIVYTIVNKKGTL